MIVLFADEAVIKKRQKETDDFLKWREKMVAKNPIPFPEDVRNYKEREVDMKRFFENKVVVEAYEHKRGGYSWEFKRTEGTIEEIRDGLWGYEGDAIAVKINGEFYPSSQVRVKGE